MKKKNIIVDDKKNKNKKNTKNNIDDISQNNIFNINFIHNIGDNNFNLKKSDDEKNNNFDKLNDLDYNDKNLLDDNLTNSSKSSNYIIDNDNINDSNNSNDSNDSNNPNDLNIQDNLINKNIDDNDIGDSDNNNIYLKELLRKQIKTISNDKKLNYNDIKRISKFLSSSIFDKNKCSIWNGYITNEKNQSKGTYINFYFNKKKIALHRLLYINYIEDISNNEYIKFSCANKGKCCNINHMKKYIYNKNLNNPNGDNTIDKSPEQKQSQSHEQISINFEKNKLIVEL